MVFFIPLHFANDTNVVKCLLKKLFYRRPQGLPSRVTRTSLYQRPVSDAPRRTKCTPAQ